MKSESCSCMSLQWPIPQQWFEVAPPLAESTVNEAQNLFDEHWLARCPHSQMIGFDDGSKFKKEFLDLCEL